MTEVENEMAMKASIATLLREDAVALCRQIEADAHRGNAYAASLLSLAKQVARQATTNDEAVQAARSILVDPYGRTAQERAGLLTDRAALRATDIVVSITSD